MLNSLNDVTKGRNADGIPAAVFLGFVVGGMSMYFAKDIHNLLGGTERREPPYVYPDISPEDLLATAYRMQPFYDIRREGTEKMFALIGEKPSALLTAVAAYRTEGYAIEATGLGSATIEDVEDFIHWCLEHGLDEAASAAKNMLETYLEKTGEQPIPLREPRAF